LLGPLSETISNVSWRDCAFAEDQIAGQKLRHRRPRPLPTSESHDVSSVGSPEQADAGGGTAKVVPELECANVALLNL
jgi:hypothetical protein